MAREGAFRESQPMRQVWIWVVVVAIAALAWWAFVRQILMHEPFGPEPAPAIMVWTFFLAFGIGLPLFAATARLVVTVDAETLEIRWFPLCRRRIPLEEIASAEPRTYRPLREYWGWGIRWMPGRGMAYSMSGNQGVQLTLASGKRILVGSTRPADLAAALTRVR